MDLRLTYLTVTGEDFECLPDELLFNHTFSSMEPDLSPLLVSELLFHKLGIYGMEISQIDSL